MASVFDDRPPLLVKAGIAVALIALADFLMFADGSEGLNLGLLLLTFTMAAAVHPELWKRRLGVIALAEAGVLALVQIEHFSPLAWLLFWTALGVAVLAACAPEGEGAWPWAQRLATLGAKSLVGPLIDLREVGRARDGRAAAGLKALPLMLAMPLIGAVIFVWLFAVANPLIGDWFAAWSLPEPDVGRILFWGFVGLLAWGVLRPRFLGKTWGIPDARTDLILPGVSPASVTLSLVIFNAVFALQNVLDLAFLWSGAKLPEGMTFAGYAHRGAYPLIATALLAGLFVLVFLRPGSETARRPLVRWLVAAWIVQNLFLVASTALRTFDYVEAYSLTRLRIAALIWMALVAIGLALTGWRLLRDKSAAWLINANVLAAGVVLAGCSVVDLGAVAAHWNVRHAREVGGRGAPLDLSYMRELGPAALVSLAAFETKPVAPDTRLKADILREDIMRKVERKQAQWRSWTWRDARRLARTREKLQSSPGLPPLTPPAKP